MDIMGNDTGYIEMFPAVLKERVGETVVPVQKTETLLGKWESVFKGFMDMPDQPHMSFEFFENGTWSDGEENNNVEWKLMNPNILILQSCYGPIPEVDDPGGLSEEGYYVYSTLSGKIIFSNADTSVLIQLTKIECE